MKPVDLRHGAFQWLRSKGRNGTHYVEFVRFIICGGVNTGVTFIIYLCLLWLVPYAVAYSISYVAGIFISYWLNAKFVFEEPLSLVRALQYPFVYLVQYVVGLGLLFLLVEITHVSEIIAPLLVVILTLPITFLLSRCLIRGSFGPSQRRRPGL